MKKMESGLLVAVEGIDGCGKSLLSQNLYYQLKNLEKEVVLTKEPSGTLFGEKIYTSFINSDFVITPETAFLLFAASRSEHFDKIVIPELKKNKIVISDRMGDSSLVYQGYVEQCDIEMLKKINTWVMKSIHPQITFYVRIDVSTALKRIAQRGSDIDIFEKRSFLEDAIIGFDTLYKDRKDVVILDGTQEPLLLAHQALKKILEYYEQ